MRRRLRTSTKRWQMLAILSIAACSESDSAVRPRLDWVNPGRCVSPCDHPSPTNLVAIDAFGLRAVEGKVLIDEAAQPALEGFLARARSNGHEVTVRSGYRAYERQALIFTKSHATQPGRVARPGHSEHELGLAVDLGFRGRASRSWLGAHAHEHGFVCSYPRGKERLTGYRHEPWHFRFVGQTVAREVREQGVTLEEWFEQHPEQAKSGDCSDCTNPASSSDCGTVTTRGICEGSVLVWCMKGAKTSVDCAKSNRGCALRGDALGFECVE